MQAITGVSPDVDSCSAMILGLTARHYRGVKEEHRRWIDPEDLLQEALIAACAAERGHSLEKGAKFSTYCYRGVDMALLDVHVGFLGRKKRTGAIVELDYKDPDTELPPVVLADTQSDFTQELDIVASVLALARAVSERAVVVLVRGLLCGDGAATRYPAEVEELRVAATKLQLSYSQLGGIQKSEKIRRKCLTSIGKHVMLSSESDAKLRVLDCVGCRGRFTIGDVYEDRFVVDTMTCSKCYRGMASESSALSCFGSWNRGDTACRLHCLDRVQCKHFKENSMSAKSDKTGKKKVPVEAKGKKVVTIDDMDFGDIPSVKVEETKTVEKKVKAAKSAKADKPEKAAKVKKTPAAAKTKIEDPDGTPPKEVGWRWPYKANSGMRYLFKKMLEGLSASQVAKVQKDLEGKSFKWAFLLKCLRQGASGIQPRITHTWRVDETGGGLKIYDVKCIVPDPSKVVDKVKDKTAAEKKAPVQEEAEATTRTDGVRSVKVGKAKKKKAA